MSTNDWNEYFNEAISKTPPLPDKTQNIESESSSDWNEYFNDGMKNDQASIKKEEPRDYSKPIFTENESNIDWGERQAARLGARGIETVLGLPGDVGELLRSSIGKGVKQLYPEKTPEFLKKYTGEPTKIKELTLPTSEDIKKFHEPHTKQYLKPQTENEAIADDTMKDFSSLVIPMGAVGLGTRAVGLMRSFLRAASIAVGGQTVKQTAKVAGTSEETADVLKNGSMFLFNLYQPGHAREIETQLYRNARNSIDVTDSGDASQLARHLRHINSEISMGTRSTSESAVLKESNAVLDKIHNNQMSFLEAVASKRSINEEINKFINETPDRMAKARARRLLPKITHALDNFISQAEHSHPDFYYNQVNADNVHGAIAGSNRAREFIRENASSIVKSGIPTEALALWGGYGPESIAVAAGGALALEGQRLLYQMWKSPVLRDHYLRTLVSATAENLPSTIRNMKKVSKGIEEKNQYLEKNAPQPTQRQIPQSQIGNSGMLEPGNIDLTNRPVVHNPDGSISTVASKSYDFDGKEVLLPTVSDDGRVLNDQETTDQFLKTGKHLGVFSSPEAATRHAQQLHEDQEKFYAPFSYR